MLKEEYAQVARWLVHAASWGTLSTISTHLHGAPYGNAVSYAAEESTGRPLFYLTAFDASAQDVAANSTATLTVCELQLPGACSDVDPQDPTCAKASLSGKLLRKRNPLVMVGAVATAGVLCAGLVAFKRGNQQLSQQMMRARVGFQFATVALMAGSSGYYALQQARPAPALRLDKDLGT
ncbi:hypothetical protein WJX81_008497 [Elliptochloris bilobata]|uniref:HIG1 domain-containing protein n=1 Tax=Elliptochloris bilobata TaxID=381761 RepID=A0AAW1QZ62_9CHLO